MREESVLRKSDGERRKRRKIPTVVFLFIHTVSQPKPTMGPLVIHAKMAKSCLVETQRMNDATTLTRDNVLSSSCFVYASSYFAFIFDQRHSFILVFNCWFSAYFYFMIFVIFL